MKNVPDEQKYILFSSTSEFDFNYFGSRKQALCLNSEKSILIIFLDKDSKEQCYHEGSQSQ